MFLSRSPTHWDPSQPASSDGCNAAGYVLARLPVTTIRTEKERRLSGYIYIYCSIHLTGQILLGRLWYNVILIHLWSTCQERLMSRERAVDSEETLIHGGFLMAGGNSWMVYFGVKVSGAEYTSCAMYFGPPGGQHTWRNSHQYSLRT